MNQEAQAKKTLPPPAKSSGQGSGVGWLFRKLFQFFASFGLAITVLSLLLIITLVGTLEQQDIGLYQAQKKYFDSLFTFHEIGSFKIPLPGAFLLTAVLFVNLVCGGIIRARKGIKTIGILISHFSILLLILAGGVSFFFKKEGNMQLYEGDTSNIFMAYHDWVIEIMEVRDGEIHGDVTVIPFKDFSDRMGEKVATFHGPHLPFEMKITGFIPNCRPLSAASAPPRGEEVVIDGHYLHELKRSANNERNVGGAIAEIIGKDGESLSKTLLCGIAWFPHSFEADGSTYAIQMKRESWEVPFLTRLDKFTRKLHPGTSRPKEFRSDVVRLVGGDEQKVAISMNEPMRYNGYTFFQASWGPEDARPGEKLYTVLAVVKNPSDHWPLICCILAGIGLCIQFLMSLFRFLKTSSRKREAIQNAV